MMLSLYETIHISTAVVDESEEPAIVAKIFQFKQLERRIASIGKFTVTITLYNRSTNMNYFI